MSRDGCSLLLPLSPVVEDRKAVSVANGRNAADWPRFYAERGETQFLWDGGSFRPVRQNRSTGVPFGFRAVNPA